MPHQTAAGCGAPARRMHVLTAPITLPVFTGMVAATAAGVAMTGAVITTGHTPHGALDMAVHGLTLLAMVAIQVRAVWRVRDEPAFRYAALTTASTLAAITLILVSFSIGAVSTWVFWSLAVNQHAQNAVMAGAAAAALGSVVISAVRRALGRGEARLGRRRFEMKGLMMVYVTAVHLVGGSGHQHIEEFWWLDPGDGKTGKTSRGGMVDYIRNKNGVVKVGGPDGPVAVHVVDGHPPLLRTVADNQWSDNLLALPKY